jgi:hypothetical protein
MPSRLARFHRSLQARPRERYLVLSPERSTVTMQTGGLTRERSDDYIRVTVFLATVLFLTALKKV